MPQKLMMAAKNFTPPGKAKNADVYLLTESTFNEFPDLLVSGPNFTDLKKVSDANPQKAKLLWGTSELIRFKNSDGVPLSANPDQAGELRSEKEVSDDGLHLRAAFRGASTAS